MNASRPERKSDNRRERDKVELELSSDKQYILKNKDAKEGNEITIKIIPHQDGNVSMAVFNGGNLEKPVFTKKLWAQPLEEVNKNAVNKLADVFPTAQRAREMQEAGVAPPPRPRPRPTQGSDRNGIKRL